MLRTRATMRPGDPGTKKLLAKYGSRLVCVRYRDDAERKTRCKTVELIVEEQPWPPTDPGPKYAPDDIVHVFIRFDEETLRAAVRNRNGEFDRPTKTWRLRYADALALRLLERIVVPGTAPRGSRNNGQMY